MTQFILNVKVSKTTKTTSYFANFGKELNLFERSRNQVSIEFALKKGNKIKEIQDNIFKMQKKSTTYQNKKRKMALLLKKGNKMYLYTKNLKINKEKNKKLDHVKVEPFFIKNIKRSMNYELNFLVDVKMWSMFHVSLLKSTHSKTFIQITFQYQKQKDQEYEVERILRQKNQQYLVKWKGYPITKNTWESREHLTNCSRKLKRFQENQRT